jgi:hypothetical protein
VHDPEQVEGRESTLAVSWAVEINGRVVIGVEPPEPAGGVHFQALPLSTWSDKITGTFRYATPFDQVD